MEFHIKFLGAHAADVEGSAEPLIANAVDQVIVVIFRETNDVQWKSASATFACYVWRNWFFPELNTVYWRIYRDKACLETVLALYRQQNIKVLNMQITRSTGSDKHNACFIFPSAQQKILGGSVDFRSQRYRGCDFCGGALNHSPNIKRPAHQMQMRSMAAIFITESGVLPEECRQSSARE